MPKAAKNPKIKTLVDQLTKDYPNIKFQIGRDFHWSPDTSTVFYNPNESNAGHLLLHEAAHALLNHRSYRYDNELIQMEVAAWEHSRRNFYPKYLPKFSQTVADEYLEYYRNWLYERSLCPTCGLVGQQLSNLDYHCLSCQQKWRPNSAKQSQLKRYKLK